MTDELTLEEKANAYSDAVILALVDVGSRLGKPDISAALAALAGAQAYMIANIDDPVQRIHASTQIADGLGPLIRSHRANILSRRAEQEKAR
jgi:hypothetical protein